MRMEKILAEEIECHCRQTSQRPRMLFLSDRNFLVDDPVMLRSLGNGGGKPTKQSRILPLRGRARPCRLSLKDVRGVMLLIEVRLPCCTM